jgi:hypothetical protein
MNAKVQGIKGALHRAGVIKTVRVGDQRPGGNASEFRASVCQK